MLGPRIRDLRRECGLTQADLAARAGVSRQLVGAVEAGRQLPRVDAAAAIARVLGSTVERLLTPESVVAVGVLDGPQPAGLVRLGRVGDRLVCLAARPAVTGFAPADGIIQDGEVHRLRAERPVAVVAGCDPVIGLVERLVEADVGPAVLTASAANQAAVAALAAGRVHAVVVHGRHGALPEPPVPVRRWLASRWQVGLAASADLPDGWAALAMEGRCPVVQRETGAGAQAAFERAVARAGGAVPIPGPRAGGHLEAAAWAARDGLVGVSIEPAARAHGLRFHALEEHVTELWIARDHLDAPGVRRFADELLSGRGVRRHLAAIGGYDLTDAGTEVAA